MHHPHITQGNTIHIYTLSSIGREVFYIGSHVANDVQETDVVYPSGSNALKTMRHRSRGDRRNNRGQIKRIGIRTVLFAEKSMAKASDGAQRRQED